MKRWPLLLGALLIPSVAQAEVDVTRYVLELEVDPQAQVLVGDAAVELVADGQPLSLDFVGMEVDQVLLDEAPVAFTREAGQLRLDAAPPQGQPVVVRVRYHGQPDPYVEPWGAWGVVFEPERVFTLNVIEGARHWLPSHDALHDRAALTLSVTAPSAWKVAAPGSLVGVEEVDEGRSTTTWRADWDLPTYHIHFAAAPYEVIQEEHGGVPYTYWLTPSTDRASALETLSHAPRATALWVQRYGAYPFPKVGFDEINLGGAVENTSCVSIGQQVLNANTTFEEVVAHEMAHAWFQGVVTTATWEDLWLSEGLATYHEALYYAHTRAEDPDALADYTRSLATGYKSVASLGEGIFPVYDPQVLFGVTTYRKGALVFHMLRYLVGDQAFDDTLRAWLERYRYQAATTAQFQALAEEIHGDSLEDFFQQWVYGAGYPDYRLSWRQAQGGQVEVLLRQVQQEGGPFTLPVQLRLSGQGQERLVTLEVDGARAQGSFQVNFVPEQVTLDPQGWLLKDSSVEPWPEEPPEPDMGLPDMDQGDMGQDTGGDLGEDVALGDGSPDASEAGDVPQAQDLASGGAEGANPSQGCGCQSVGSAVDFSPRILFLSLSSTYGAQLFGRRRHRAPWGENRR
jgi:aminopeptidase N